MPARLPAGVHLLYLPACFTSSLAACLSSGESGLRLVSCGRHLMAGALAVGDCRNHSLPNLLGGQSSCGYMLPMRNKNISCIGADFHSRTRGCVRFGFTDDRFRYLSIGISPHPCHSPVPFLLIAHDCPATLCLSLRMGTGTLGRFSPAHPTRTRQMYVIRFASRQITLPLTTSSSGVTGYFLVS